MRVLDVRWVRLAIAAGAIAGSALVSSVAVAADESPSTEPPVTTTLDPSSIELDPSGVDGIVVDPPPGGPLDDIAVIEIVVPDLNETEPGTVDPTIVEPVAPTDVEESADEIAMTASEPASSTSLAMEMAEMGSQAEAEGEEGGEGEHGSGHEGGSGGQGNPYRMTFTVVWEDASGEQITTFDAILTPEVLAQFELVATSQTGKGKVTSATCTYPDDGMVLRCEFHNPGHGSGTDGLIIPARPTATYTVTVDPIEGWTITGANDDAYSARDLCPRGGEGGHEEGGHEEGGHEESSLEEGGSEEGGHEGGGHEGGEQGGGEQSGGEQGGSVPCVHTVVMRWVAVAPPPPPTEPPAPPAQDSAVVPPVATTVVPTTTEIATTPEVAVQAFAPAPRALPTTGGSISMIVLAGGVLVAIGSALAGLTRRTS